MLHLETCAVSGFDETQEVPPEASNARRMYGRPWRGLVLFVPDDVLCVPGHLE